MLEAPLSTVGVYPNLPAPTGLYVLAVPGTEIERGVPTLCLQSPACSVRLNFGVVWYCINIQRSRGCVSLNTSLGILPWQFRHHPAWVRSKHLGVLSTRGVEVCGSEPHDPYSEFRSGGYRSV